MIIRRQFCASILAASVIFLQLDMVRADAANENAWRATMHAILGKAEPIEDRVKFEAPFIVRSGSPFSIQISVASPMNAANYVLAVHVLATRDWEPRVASFYFTPRSGKALVSTRIRLNKSEKLIAIAQMSDGTWYVGQHVVKIRNYAYAP